jgi:serine/threonine protein kinase
VQAVALKVLKPGMDSRAVVARFELERQALALMDHPGIAKVLDGGLTDEQSRLGPGRPYFVMELVRGVPITDYCREHALPIAERLRLFLEVCDAVQHAHTKGVIHRDLKPSNILVTEVGGRAVPKVIDFGVAKAVATARPAGEQTMTMTGQFIGTPEYMSPEQAAGGGDDAPGGDIDTRADVYALGVVLYKLLTGMLPFEPDQLWKAGIFETMRVIREVEPPKPSTRVASVARTGVSARTRGDADAKGGAESATRIDAAGAASAPRAGATPEPADALARRLRGDLDWICMRALEKARERRYQSPGSLADDIRRYLQSEPVEAGPPEIGYRVRKFVRRNRVLVAGVAATMLALAIGLAAALVSLTEARRQRGIAEAQTRQAEANLVSAQRQRDHAAAALRLIMQSITVAHPGTGGEVTIPELLQEIESRLRSRVTALPPEMRVSVLRQLGELRRARGELAAAEGLLTSARVEAASLGEAGVADAAGALIELARVRNDQNQPEQALALIDEAEAVLRDAAAPERASLLGQAGTTAGASLRRLGRREDAIKRLQDAIAVISANVGESSTMLINPMLELSQVLLEDPKRRSEALELATRTVDLCRALQERGEAGETLVFAANNTLGRARMDTGDLSGAADSFADALALGQAITALPEAHLATTHHNLASVLRELGRGDDAMRHIEQAITTRQRLAGQIGTLPLARSLDVRAGLRADAGDLDGAASDYREELEQIAEPEGAQALEAARAQTGLADVLVRQGKFEAAARVAERALKARKRLLAAGDWPIWSTQSVLSAALAGAGETARAESLMSEALEYLRKDPATTPARMRRVLERAAEVYDRAGKSELAEACRAEMQKSAR